MSRYYYDLHIHSALSPCADNESTPNSIAGMAKLAGLDIIALTDHNTTRNCPAFFEAAKRYGLIPVAGMELTTSEDIHLVCLFRSLGDAMRFGQRVERSLMPIKNRPDIFGEQLVMDSEDNVIASVENLLSVASDISVNDAPAILSEYGGICYPAHIDRDSNGIIAIFGTLPESPHFNTVEFRDAANIKEYTEKYGLQEKNTVVNSDSHYLGTINDREHFLEMSSLLTDEDAIRKELIRLLE